MDASVNIRKIRFYFDGFNVIGQRIVKIVSGTSQMTALTERQAH